VKAALLLLAAAMAVIPAGVIPAGAAASGAPVIMSHIAVPVHAHTKFPTHGGTADSKNWSGYVVQAANVTGVDGSFTVPTVDGTPGLAAVWAVIGGFGTSDLIQAGVQVDSLGVGVPYAWYEILPAGEVALSGCKPDPNCTVAEGDAMAVHIHQSGINAWSIQVADSTAGWTFSIPVTYQSRQLSAEWILESPTLLVIQSILPLMHDTVFSGANTFNVGVGGPHPIAAGNPTTVLMHPIDASVPIVEGAPTALDATGEGFIACAYPLLGCPSNLLLNLL
jgi:hypothetical protein